MWRLFYNTYVTIFTMIFLVLALSNVFVFHSAVLGAGLLTWFLVQIGNELGKAAAPSEKGLGRWSAGVWLLGSIIAIVGSIVYYLWEFNLEWSVVLLILFFPIARWLAVKYGKSSHAHDVMEGARHHVPASSWFSAAFVLTLLAVCFLLIQSAATGDAIRSPWERIPLSMFFAFGLSSLLLVALLLRGRERMLCLTLSIASLLVVFSVALLVFPIGYGFDSFIHQATESHIAEFGTITPKPFYYIGQYTLVLFLHFAFAIPIEWADKLLLPILAALLLPMAWYVSAAHLLQEKRTAAASLPAIFLIPLTSFIVTTPQGLANLWTWLTLLFAVPRLLNRERWPLWPVAIGAFATALVHPVAGIPILLFLVLLLANPSDPRQRHPTLARIVSWITIIIGGIILPLSFAVNAWISDQRLRVDLSALSPSRLLEALHLEVFLENRFSPVLDFVYLFSFNRVLLVVLLAITGAWIWRKTHGSLLKPLIAMGGILGVNFLVMRSAVEFTFLIDYERANYADRLVPLALFFLSPFVILLAGRAAERLRERPIVLRASAVTLAAAVMASAFYLAYPRTDNYEMSHGYNTSQADVDAVLDVERDAADTDYVVLANQSVSAAAIREMGFVRYYDDVFYYPIPTGGPLYQLFLDMNERPNLETVQSAMDLAHVDVLYFLVNNYWWQAGRIIETAKTNANAWWAIGDGAVHVFKYTRATTN